MRIRRESITQKGAKVLRPKPNETVYAFNERFTEETSNLFYHIPKKQTR